MQDLSATGRWKRMGLARQLWILLVLPTALALALYGFFAHRNRQRVIMAEASAELRNYATLIDAALHGGSPSADAASLQQRLEGLARAERIAGIAAFEEGHGLVMVTSALEGSRAELAEIARRALERGQPIEEEETLATGPTLVRTLTLSPPARPDRLVIVIARDLEYVTALAHVLDRGLMITGTIVIGLIALVAGWVSRTTVGQPVLGIVRGASRVAAGDLGTQVTETGARELRQLARSFNEMTAALAAARADLEREAESRATIERRLAHLQALAAAGQIAASVGHEIGSPLNVILGRARRAASNPACPESLRKELDTIAHQSERISRVVSGLLAVARPVARATSAADVARVAEDVLAFLAPECRRRRVAVIVELSEARPIVALDPDALFQIVFNLCMNALQAQPGGGTITVSFGEAPASASGEPRAFVAVSDGGPGVPESDRERIFDAFYTTKSDAGGSGLGLAIVGGIVREAGGQVEVTGAARGGACFRVILPAARAEPSRERASA